MPAELASIVLLALLSLALALATVVIHFERFGGKVIRGNRDHYPALEGLAGRAVRAHAGLNEALLPFAAIMIAILYLGIANRWTMIAAVTFLLARLCHALCYLFGLTPWRSVAFYVGVAATLLGAAQLPLVLT